MTRSTRAPLSSFSRALSASANLDIDLENLSPETLARIEIRAREILEGPRGWMGWVGAMREARNEIVGEGAA